MCRRSLRIFAASIPSHSLELPSDEDIVLLNQRHRRKFLRDHSNHNYWRNTFPCSRAKSCSARFWRLVDNHYAFDRRDTLQYQALVVQLVRLMERRLVGLEVDR